MTDWFASVAALVAAEPGGRADSANRLAQLCAAATRALGASGAGVTVMLSDRVRGVSAASDSEAERLEDLEFTTGEGPSIDAFALQRPVLLADLDDGAARRWPIYTPAAYASGVRAVFAFPLQLGAAQLGMMVVFRGAPGALSDDEVTLAVTFADVAVALLLDGQPAAGAGKSDRHGGGDAIDHLGSGAELYQAQGMAMVQLGVTIEAALVRMRAHAYAESRSLGDVAADIVARRLVLDRDDLPS